MEDLFKFRMDADISKSADDADERRLIRGYASTQSQDRQGETLIQKGLDISDFVDHGWFNYDHDNSIILGHPIEGCRVGPDGFWVEGELLKGVKEAERIWDLALALRKSNSPRKIGFSVEGKVLERNGNQIVKAKIYNVAITTNPVNTTCSWEAVVKSFSPASATYVSGYQTASINKALEAGYETNPLEKEGGEVFISESLDKDLHNLSYVMGDEANKKILKQKLSTKKSLTANETALYLHLTQGWSHDQCMDFIRNHIK